jgi:hypothetical protein
MHFENFNHALLDLNLGFVDDLFLNLDLWYFDYLVNILNLQARGFYAQIKIGPYLWNFHNFLLVDRNEYFDNLLLDDWLGHELLWNLMRLEHILDAPR